MDSVPDWPFGPRAVAVASLVIASLAYFVFKLRRARKFFSDLRDRGLPVPNHSFALGHLLEVQREMKSFPADAMVSIAIGRMTHRFPDQGCAYYLDMWPIMTPILVIANPHLANQATQATKIAYEKPESLREWFLGISGGTTIFDSREHEWKPWRSIFSPGFSNDHLLSLIPSIVEETGVYTELLTQHAKRGDVFKLDPLTLRLTMDLIGREVLRPIKQRWNSYHMNKYVGAQLDYRYEVLKSELGKQEKLRSKSVLDLTLQAFTKGKEVPKRLDPEFRKVAIRQIRMFLFAGHDSTSSTICWCLYMLAKNPGALKKVMAEHDQVLGSDAGEAGARIIEKPTLVNELAYTLAIIKETLRIFPPASSIRAGHEDVDIVDEKGTRFPTKDCMVWIIHETLQKSPIYWERPQEFLPERWLVGPEDPLYPMKGAFRAFEFGPRNCIGQTHVLLQIKVVLALVVRRFDIQPAYDVWDQGHPTSALKSIAGERAYMVEEVSAHPADQLPCTVSLRER